MDNKKGITLIALVVTIIVLLILAGVVIATLTGDNGLLTKAGQAKIASEQANLEEEVQLALIEGQGDKYFNTNSTIEEKLKAIFEKNYGQGNIDVTKAGKNYKAKVKNSKTAYRVKADGTVEKYEEMDPTSVYARLDDDGILYLRATKYDDDYKLYSSSDSIQSNWNTANNATKSSVTKVAIDEPIAPSDLTSMFKGFVNLLEIENIKNLHTENAISMNNMFNHCEKITKIDLSMFDTSKVNDMTQMFDWCYNLEELDVTNFNTSNCKNMSLMFIACSKLNELDVSGFCTDNVENMQNLFSYCSSLKSIDISNFNTVNVKIMNHMFYGCSKIEHLNFSNFNTSNVTDINHMFWRMWFFNKCKFKLF